MSENENTTCKKFVGCSCGSSCTVIALNTYIRKVAIQLMSLSFTNKNFLLLPFQFDFIQVVSVEETEQEKEITGIQIEKNEVKQSINK